MQWTLKSKEDVFMAIPFTVQSLTLIDNKSQKPMSHPFYRLKTPDWVNVLAITPDLEAVLVKQQRAGTLLETLEVPGGVVDKGEDPNDAALRELEEETGYSSQKLIYVGKISPNPAIMTNNLHMYLALDCFLLENRSRYPDENEDITLVMKQIGALESLILDQSINSALSALTILTSKSQWQHLRN